MGLGFFNTIQKISREATLVPRCWECRLHEKCKSPKMPVWGRGERKVLIVGEAPGPEEDALGEPFVGRVGKKLRDTLKEFGVILGRDCWVTNSLICYPWEMTKIKGEKIRHFRPPTPQEVSHCRPNLLRTIKELNPEVIILLGGSAVSSLIGWLWKEEPGGMERWDGWKIPCQRLNAWICPTWHPSYILRNKDEHEGRIGESYSRRDAEPVEKFFWRPRLEAAFKLDGRPWKEVPDYKKQIRVELDPQNASVLINSFVRRGYPIAFDFECDSLKPDNPKLDTYSCALSDGDNTIAYPWHGEAIKATSKMLSSPLAKIGHNIKYESRWALSKLGINIANWVWDSMLAAHVLDSRPGITSLKYQSFVLLGQESYDDDIKPYLISDSANKPNRIREVDIKSVLLYNGMDALLTYKVAEIQRERLGIVRWSRNGLG